MATDGPITFRPLAWSDFGRLRTWSRQEHVVEWWGPGLDENQVERKYGPRVDGTEPVHVYIVELAGVPIGWIQSYLLADQPGEADAVGLTDAAGIDVAIGETGALRRGIGRRIIREFVSTLVFPKLPDVMCCVACPSKHNDRAQRAFAAAGFRPFSTIRKDDGGREVAMVLRRGDVGRESSGWA